MKKVKAEKKKGQELKSPAKKQQEKRKDSGKEKASDADLPGYPHYSPSEDILHRASRVPAENLDDISLPSLKTASVKKQIPGEMKMNEPGTGESKIVPGTEADVTQEDLRLLNSSNLNSELGDDEILKRRPYPVDMAGEDLDVPGTELDDASEEIGQEDEENNNYSIGGDRHEDLEENHS